MVSQSQFGQITSYWRSLNASCIIKCIFSMDKHRNLVKLTATIGHSGLVFFLSFEQKIKLTPCSAVNETTLVGIADNNERDEGRHSYLGLVLQALDTVSRLEVVEVQTLVISTYQGQRVLQVDVPDNGFIAVLLQYNVKQQSNLGSFDLTRPLALNTALISQQR